MRGLFFTSPIKVQSASPVYIWLRVRPCMVKAAMPQSCNRSAKSTIIFESWSQPNLVFTVTGIFTGIDHGSGNFQQQRDIPQHTGSGAFAGYLFYRTAEVYIQYVGISLLATTSRIDHGIDKTSVNLYGDRSLRIPVCSTFAWCC